ncbi:MAG: hypothetical protein M0R77_16670 [Gammaproteobacteria bacterium]|nr:hypothetical protein [Gammaproteobacteria bacterium]
MKEIAIIANVLGSAYFMGGMLAQHERAKTLVAGLEKGFLNLLLELKEKKPSETIRLLLRLFGFLTGASFVGILLAGILGLRSQQLALALSIVFLVSGLFAGSLFWVLKHKEVLKQTARWLLFFGGGSLLFPVMDVLTDAGITNVVYSMMQTSFARALDLPDGNGLVYEAFVVSGFYAGFVIFFYVIAWFYAAPTALVAWSVVAVPIIGARVISHAFPEKPIAFLFFALWLFSVFYFAYGS